jgi:hypothetical protein
MCVKYTDLGEKLFKQKGVFEAECRSEGSLQRLPGRLPDPPEHVQPVLPAIIIFKIRTNFADL